MSATIDSRSTITRSDRLEVIAAARAMAAEGLVVGTVGNLSVRRGDRILITPTRLPYDRMTAGDLVTIDLEGRPLDGAPSREAPLHLAIYLARADVGAVVHTHSPHATAWSFLGESLSPATEDNAYYGIGPVRTSPPAPPASQRLGEVAAATIAESAAVLLGDHGVLAVGPDIVGALDVARVVEHQAQVAWLLRGRAASGGFSRAVRPGR